MMLGEIGRFPIDMTIKTHMITFWTKLILCEKDNISVTMYKILYSHHVNDITKSKWLASVKQTLDNCGYSFIWMHQDVNINRLALLIKQSLQDQLRQDWQNTVFNSNTCVLCRVHKSDHA